MDAVRIRRKLESDTLTLPELRPFVGKTVEIVIQEAEQSGDAAPYAALFAPAGTDVLDPDAYRRLREASEL